MPVNKNSMLRYRIIDACLRDTTHDYTIMDLVNAVNRGMQEIDRNHTIGERQLYDDLNYMKSIDGFNAEIDSYRFIKPDEKGRNRSYTAFRYHDVKCKLTTMPITQKEILYLRAAATNLYNAAAVGFTPEFPNALNNLMTMLGGFDENPGMQFECNPYLGGARARLVTQNLEKIYDAIKKKEALTLTYQPYGQAEQVVHYHPVYLKQCERMWYAYGVTTEVPDKIVTLPVERIMKVEPCKDAYVEFPFDPESYFEDIIGVYNDDSKPVDVHLLLYGMAAYLVESSPIHGSQRSKWVTRKGEKALDVHLDVKLNVELESFLMACMDSVVVLGPRKLKEKHLARVRRAMEINGVS